MPKKARELTALEVKRLRQPGAGGNIAFAVGDVDGLTLQITPTGARSWLLRASIDGKRRNIGLGPFPSVTLAQARERARETKQAIWEGRDPIEERRTRRVAAKEADLRRLKFSDAMEGYLASKLTEFRSEKHQRQWRSTLETYSLPVIGEKPVSEIEVSDIQAVLAPIWSSKTETASRLRGRIESVLAWATVQGHRSGDNPARWRGNLDAVLPKPSSVSSTRHHAALKIAELRDWYAALQLREGMSARALEFLALTAARSGEVRGATWDEIDLETGLWTIPATRMKAGREHRVPLPHPAIDLLRRIPRLAGSGFVFPSARGQQLSDMALSQCMRKISASHPGRFLDTRSGRPAVPHGLRSTFRDWAAEKTDYPREMAEIALAHRVGSDVERAYRRTDMLEKRREMMARSAEALTGANKTS